MRVVLDTNVVISGIFFGGVPGEIVKELAEARFSAFATPLILEEYLETIQEISRSKPAPLLKEWLEILPSLFHVIPDIEIRGALSRDLFDDKFLLCAAKARVQYLVTGDKDFSDLKSKFDFQILSPREFLSKIGA